MNDKLSEIEMWKYEDQNQYQDVLLEFDERAEGIRKCIEYVNSFIKYESDETTNDIFEICFNGNHKELCKIDINKFSIDMIENLIIKLKRKIMDIETSKSEELNQTAEKQTELNELTNNIFICINYLGTLYQRANETNIIV